MERIRIIRLLKDEFVGMLAVFLFSLAVIFSIVQICVKKEWHSPKAVETLLSYLLLFNVGIMGIFAAYAHLFMGPETATSIGWEPGSPFQAEIGMANLSYGVLGLIAFLIRGRFWDATIIGWSVLLIGCFVVHIISYMTNHNTAPYNIGVYIWFWDLILPILLLTLLTYLRAAKTTPL